MLCGLAPWRESLSGMVNASCWPHAGQSSALKEMRQAWAVNAAGMCRVATAYVSRGFQPTVGVEKGFRRVATVHVGCHKPDRWGSGSCLLFRS